MEMVVVLMIITLGLVGVLSLMIQNVQVEYVNKNNMVASQLAQEGLELVRNMRDKNWMTAGANWYDGFADDTVTRSYRIDNSGILEVTMANAVLNISANGYNHQALGTASLFSRLLTISRSDTDSATISVRVAWTDRGTAHNYIANTVLYDWK